MNRLGRALPLMALALTQAFSTCLLFSSSQAQCQADTTNALLLDYLEFDGYGRACASNDSADNALWEWYTEGLLGEAYIGWEDEVTDYPSVGIWTLEQKLSGRRAVQLNTHGDILGGTALVAVEYYETYHAMLDAMAYYRELLGTWSPDELMGASWPTEPEGGTVYSVAVSPTGVLNHFYGLVADEAILSAQWCYSTEWMGKLGEATFVGYDEGIPWTEGCRSLGTFWGRMACRKSSCKGHTECAAAGTDLVLAGSILQNYLDCGKTCNNPEVWFAAAGAFGNVVWWWTDLEIGSVDFVVRGYASELSEPDTLAIMPASGGCRVRQHYRVGVGGDYPYYEIVERDDRGREEPSGLFEATSRPPDWETWVSSPRIAWDSFEPDAYVESGPLMELVDGRQVPFETGVGSGRPGVLEGPPSDADCADVVIYTSDSLLVGPVQSHCQSEGLKVRSFVGSSNPDDARTAFTEVRTANYQYDYECDVYYGHPDACPHPYGTPLLIIIGDSEPTIVAHEIFPDSHHRCHHGPWCNSDFDITDVNGDGRPNGPVTRIPAETLEEVEKAVQAAQDFNAGLNVDDGHHLITLAGDGESSWYTEAINVMTEVEEAYLSKGFLPRPMLIQSDYENFEECRIVGAQQVNAGVLELWGLGAAASTSQWPGLFVTSRIIDSLTSEQRFVAWIPSCSIVATWKGEVVLAEQLSFREPIRTMAAAVVGHFDGGWDVQHEEFARILLEKRFQAAPGTPVAKVVWHAVRAAQQNPVLSDYARSVGVLGAYVKVPGYVCPEGNSCDVLSPDGGETWEIGTTEAIEWQICVEGGTGERVRKHSIYLTRDDGSTWDCIEDSVEASARSYDWYITANASEHCKVMVVAEMESLDVDSTWVPAWSCSSSSDGVFTIDCDVFPNPPIDPVLSTVEASPGTLFVCPCGGTESTQGPVDELLVSVTMRDSAGDTLKSLCCSLTVALSPSGEDDELCVCPVQDGNTLFVEGMTDSAGVITVSVCELGGCGYVGVTASVSGVQIADSAQVLINSPDIVEGNCMADLSDFIAFASMYQEPEWCGDYDRSGIVDLSDNITFASHYHHSCPTPGGESSEEDLVETRVASVVGPGDELDFEGKDFYEFSVSCGGFKREKYRAVEALVSYDLSVGQPLSWKGCEELHFMQVEDVAGNKGTVGLACVVTELGEACGPEPDALGVLNFGLFSAGQEFAPRIERVLAAGEDGVIEDVTKSFVQASAGIEIPGKQRVLKPILELSPNPSTSLVLVRFGVPEWMGRQVRVSVYDVRGRLVGRIYDGSNDGYARMGRIGTARDGLSLASPGVYFLRLTVDGHALRTAKMVLLR